MIDEEFEEMRAEVRKYIQDQQDITITCKEL